MKSRLSVQYKISKAQQRNCQEYAAEVVQQQQAEFTRRILKLCCICNNTLFGHGRKRLADLAEHITRLSAEHENDEVFWRHVDDRLKQLGMPFDPEDYEEMDR